MFTSQDHNYVSRRHDNLQHSQAAQDSPTSTLSANFRNPCDPPVASIPLLSNPTPVRSPLHQTLDVQFDSTPLKELLEQGVRGNLVCNNATAPAFGYERKPPRPQPPNISFTRETYSATAGRYMSVASCTTRSAQKGTPSASPAALHVFTAPPSASAKTPFRLLNTQRYARESPLAERTSVTASCLTGALNETPRTKAQSDVFDWAIKSISNSASHRNWASTSDLAASRPSLLGRRRSRSNAEFGAVPLAGQDLAHDDPFVTPKTSKSAPARPSGSSQGLPPSLFIDFGPAANDRSLSNIMQLRRRISKKDLQTLISNALQEQKGSELRMFSGSELAEVRREQETLRKAFFTSEHSYRKAVQRRHRFQVLLARTLEDGDFATAQRAAVTLGRATEHCDRLVQEMYRGRDKIHQLEAMLQTHSCSAASLALGKLNSAFLRELKTSQALREDASRYQCPTCKPKRPVIATKDRVEMLRPVAEVTQSPHHVAIPSKEPSATRLSSMSMASLSTFSFPVPPSRCRLEDSDNIPTPVVIRLEADYTSKSSRRKQFQRSASVDILILPPNYNAGEGPSVDQGLPSSAVLPLTPFHKHRERRSSLSSDSHAVHFESANTLTARSLLVRAGARRQSAPTPTLDLSMSIKRAKRGRQTAVEGPESILMALATASWWTNPDFRDAFEEGLTA